MRMDVNFKADLIGISMHYREETDTRMATLKVNKKIEESEAKTILGDRFHRVAFAAATVEEDDDGGREWEFGYTELKPKFVFEQHSLKIAGHGPLAVQPEIKSIKPSGKGEKAVTVQIYLPILVEGPKVIGDLVARFGDAVDIGLTASQAELPLDGATKRVVKRNGAFGNPEPARV